MRFSCCSIATHRSCCFYNSKSAVVFPHILEMLPWRNSFLFAVVLMVFVAFLSPWFSGGQCPTRRLNKAKLNHFCSSELSQSNYHANFIDALCDSASLPAYPRHWYRRPNKNRTSGEVKYWGDQDRLGSDERIVGMVLLGPGSCRERPLDLATQQHRFYAEVQDRVRDRRGKADPQDDVFFDILDSVCIGNYAGEGMAGSDLHLVPVKTISKGGRAKCFTRFRQDFILDLDTDVYTHLLDAPCTEARTTVLGSPTLRGSVSDVLTTWQKRFALPEGAHPRHLYRIVPPIASLILHKVWHTICVFGCATNTGVLDLCPFKPDTTLTHQPLTPRAAEAWTQDEFLTSQTFAALGDCLRVWTRRIDNQDSDDIHCSEQTLTGWMVWADKMAEQLGGTTERHLLRDGSFRDAALFTTMLLSFKVRDDDALTQVAVDSLQYL